MLPSSFAFNFGLRRYMTGGTVPTKVVTAKKK
jgi:hypothetical protein